MPDPVGNKLNTTILLLVIIFFFGVFLVRPIEIVSGSSTPYPESELSKYAIVLDAQDGASVSESQSAPMAHESPESHKWKSDSSGIAARFEQNLGQTDPEVKFLLRARGYKLFLTSNEAVLVFDAHSSKSEGFKKAIEPNESLTTSGDILRMKFLGSNPNPHIVGQDEMPGRTNYLLGNDKAKRIANVSSYGQVKYEDLYPGVDLVFYVKDQQLKYDLIVSPKTSYKSIKLKFEGASSLEVHDGDLIVKTGNEEIRQLKPYVYQESEKGRKEIKSRYKIKKSGDVSFEVGSYDKTRPLFIDPVLSYATYLGGTQADYGSKIAVDGAGHVYVVGHTSSLNFPKVNPLQSTFGGGDNWQEGDVFVTKLSPTGNTIVYSTYLGGSNDERGLGIAVDKYGKAYITGTTRSSNFPTKDAFQVAIGGGVDAFVAKLNQTGNDLEYSSYLGTSGDDAGNDISVDSNENVYIAGETFSTNFYTAGGFQLTYGGNGDGFITKINSAGSAIVHSSYLGGSDYDTVEAVKADASGNSLVTGSTYSTNFPTASAYQASSGGSADTFVSKVNSSGNSLVFSTYLGGSDYDLGYGLIVDSSGNAYITGQTSSTNFPVLNAYQPLRSGGFYDYADAFVTKLNSAGNALLYSTHLGGSGTDSGRSIKLDAAGNIFVVGSTGSSNFPTVNPIQSILRGQSDAFVTKFNSAGSSLLFSTYYGGAPVYVGDTGSEGANSIALDPAANIYVAGYTTSSNLVTKNAFDSTFNYGSYDAFVIRIDNLDNAYSISGRVRDPYGNGIAGVTISLTGSQAGSVQTDDAGNYFFGDLPNGDYTVTPTKTSYTFDSPATTFTNILADKAENFVGTSDCYINGRVTDDSESGLPGVKVTLSGSHAGSVYTNSNGDYSLNVAPGGNFTVTPSRFTYAFAPPSQTFNNLIVTQTADFVGTVTFFELTGQILDDDSLPLANVVLSLTGSDSATTQTDASGNYVLSNVPAGGDYNLQPQLTGYAFTPPSRQIKNLSGNEILNFTGYTFTITGRVTLNTTGEGLAGVSLQLNYPQLDVQVTDANGYYSFRVTPGEDFAIYPTKYHYMFTPDPVYIQNIDSDKVVNFTATQVYTIRGVVSDTAGDGLEYATVNLSGSLTGSFITYDGMIPDGSIRGGYEFFNVPAGGNYTLTPSKTGYTFFPASVTLTNYQADRTVNFVATRAYKISGRVTNGGGTGVSGVTVILNGSTTGSKTTNSNGDYSFTSLAAGGTFTVTPSKSNTVFTPGTTTIPSLNADEVADFVSSSSLTISGKLANNAGTGVSAATVSLSGSASRTVQSDSSGNYSFAGLGIGGSYWITPAKIGVGFTPRSKYLANVTTNQTLNFMSGPVGSLILNPIADAQVKDGGSASINFGTITPLEVRTSSTSNDGNSRDSYLKFDLSDLTGSIGNVKFRIYASLSASGALATTVYGVANVTWVESGAGSIVWNNKPALGSSLGNASVTSTSNAWYEIDVTNFIKTELAAGRTQVTMGVHNAGTSTNHIRINSKEATTNRPELLVSPETSINIAPTVNAGADQTVSLPSGITLDAAVTDDGNPLPTALTTTWSKVSGPGTVIFGNANAQDTTATFSLVGTYVLQLQANDGALSTSDQLQVTVNPVPGTVTLNPTADAYVRDGSSASTNFGTATTLEVRTSTSGNNRDSYLKFDITSAANSVANARLRVYASLSASGTIATAVHSVTNTTWAESGGSGITWNNKPSYMSPALSSISVAGTSYAWYDFDVTSFVNAEKLAGRNVISLALHNPSTSTPNTRINSRESATNKPELIVTPSTTSSAPRVISLSPSFGLQGTVVIVSGVNFGISQGASTIKFNNVTAAPTSWTAGSITVPVPATTTGPVVVTVGGVSSVGMIFTVAASETDTDGDGLGDSWERMYFGDLAQNGSGDYDGDGVSNLAEYLQGRNPTMRAGFDTGGGINLKVFTPLDLLQQ